LKKPLIVVWSRRYRESLSFWESAFHLANTLLEAPFSIMALDHLVKVTPKRENIRSILILIKAGKIAFHRRFFIAIQSDDWFDKAMFMPYRL